MIASKHTKIQKDERNLIQRIDVVQSLRRLGMSAPQIITEPQALQDQEIAKKPQGSGKSVFEILLLCFIVVCFSLVVLDVVMTSRERTAERRAKEIYHQYRTKFQNKGSFSLLDFKQEIGNVEKDEWSRFMEILSSSMKCEGETSHEIKCTFLHNDYL